MEGAALLAIAHLLKDIRDELRAQRKLMELMARPQVRLPMQPPVDAVSPQRFNPVLNWENGSQWDVSAGQDPRAEE